MVFIIIFIYIFIVTKCQCFVVKTSSEAIADRNILNLKPNDVPEPS